MHSPSLPQKSFSREVREKFREETFLTISFKSCVGVFQVDRAWREEACLPQANTAPLMLLKPTVDSVSTDPFSFL